MLALFHDTVRWLGERGHDQWQQGRTDRLEPSVHTALHAYYQRKDFRRVRVIEDSPERRAVLFEREITTS